jgi:hypothetical protein
MPVYEHPSLIIKREEERKVFNDPRYWTNNPPIEDAVDKIIALRNVFNMKIFIFTYRPWPDTKNMRELTEKVKNFYQNSGGFSLGLLLLKFALILKSRWLVKKLKEEPLRLITKQWLNKNEIAYDKFVFEKGNDYSSDPRAKFNNRFHIAKRKKIRFFVEDDIEKAIKLSYICDIVFLLSHPYNEPNDALPKAINQIRKNLPSNIIRVKDWNEIYQQIRRLS